MGFKEKVKTVIFPQTSFFLLYKLFQQRVTSLPVTQIRESQESLNTSSTHYFNAHDHGDLSFTNVWVSLPSGLHFTTHQSLRLLARYAIHQTHTSLFMLSVESTLGFCKCKSNNVTFLLKIHQWIKCTSQCKCKLLGKVLHA